MNGQSQLTNLGQTLIRKPEMKNEWLVDLLRFQLSGTEMRYGIALRLLSIDNEVSATNREISYLLGAREETICRAKAVLQEVGLIEDTVSEVSGNTVIRLCHPLDGADDAKYIYNYIYNNNTLNNRKKGGGAGGGKKPTPQKVSGIPLPGWLPDDLWEEYRQMRIKIRKPMTAYAASLILAKLTKFYEMGQNPVEILRQSIENSWQGVFPVKKENARDGNSDGKRSINDIVAGLEAL
jgi:hypothetical protein